MDSLTRRGLLTSSLLGAAASTIPALAAVDANDQVTPKRILIVGAHPGDPEAGCGGTIARCAQAGYAVTCLYLTRGQAGIPNKSHEQAAAIRTAEAEAACRILGATPLFAAQIDGAAEVTPARYAEFAKLIAHADPHVVFTQWPIDHHRDHRAAAALTLDAWLTGRRKFALYYYEVDLGSDTLCFHPTHHIDITATEPLKRQACMAHQSQGPQRFYLDDHVPMMRFRGMERGCQWAEAFVRAEPPAPGELDLALR
jgi:LmbE family N-acetylglucosaminyl deacetylase